MENIRCENCGMSFLGFAAGDLRPVGREECPECGGTSFASDGDEQPETDETDG